jgi:hypothetical protein
MKKTRNKKSRDIDPLNNVHPGLRTHLNLVQLFIPSELFALIACPLTWTGPVESTSSSTTRILEGRQSGRVQDVLLIQTYPGFILVRQDARCFTYSNRFRLVHTGCRQDARCFTLSHPFRLVLTGSGRTHSNLFRLVQAGCKMFTHSKLVILV